MSEYDNMQRQIEEIKARRRARAVKAIIPMIVKLAPGISIEQVVRAVEKEID